VRSVRKPKVGRGHLELGLKLCGGSGVNFFLDSCREADACIGFQV
jgi:hypothetical protein